MTNSKVPYLCGGVLFFLLAQAKPSGGTARDHAAGVKDNHKAPTVMADLVYAVTGAAGINAPKDTSKYRECQSNGSVNIPFNEAAVCDSYDSEVKNKYSATLGRMTEFVNWHIAPTKTDWLVKAILEIIETDEDILGTDLFYIQPNGQPVSKADICDMTEFVLPALLVGVMHFITVHRQDKNELGAATLDALGTKVYKRERVYGGKLGAKIQRAIRTQHSYDADSGCETSEVTSASTENNPDGQKKDTHSIIEGKILASAQAMADAWQDAVDRLADDMSGQAAKAPAHKSLNEKMLSDKDKVLLEKFRDHIEEILHYCIDNDPTAGATRITLADEIHDVCRTWNFELRKIKDTAFRQLVVDTIRTLDEYSYYLTDKFLRWIPGTETLWFRNESREEGEQLRNVLQPECYRLRCEIARLYERLYPITEDDKIEETGAETTEVEAPGATNKNGNVVHQTIVNQYGDHPIHIDHVENLKL